MSQPLVMGKGKGKVFDPQSRCRLDLVCDRTTVGLGLRPVRIAGSRAVAPTLCCQACADRTNGVGVAAGGPQ